jgi:hypothetical protein
MQATDNQQQEALYRAEAMRTTRRYSTSSTVNTLCLLNFSRNQNGNRNTINSRNESNNRAANTVWTLSTAGILRKTVKLATAWREATAAGTIGTSQCQQQKGDPQQQY